MDKDRQRDRLRELEFERNKFEVSEGFEGNLYSSGQSLVSYPRYGHIEDTTQIMENCNKLSQIMSQIESNKGIMK